ncbi:Alpha-2-macroglobulin [Bagarius yarrelli]|uniref:Alpha-2-macroglobulin n=1 Tax=Bagarius yarrelli TaxID=175774 RepID=A0A556VU55_BAGYA|nr:Alpha-2-macroglobulin [Bagarius yarrelli]
MDFIMVVSRIHIRIRLLLASLVFLSVYGKSSGPYFLVTFPAEIESGSDAKICVSLLKPNETLQMDIYLVHNEQIRTLLHEKVEKEFHSCSHFEAPQVVGESIQEIRVEMRGENFRVTDGKKVVFKSYDILTFIQTDKPIYNPGQTGLILQLSHELNAEASQGHYQLTAESGNQLSTHQFKVEKHVLPKFEATLTTPEEHSVGDEELTLKVCGKYTYGQPVPGQAAVQLCRQFRQPFYEAPLITPCLSETVEIGQNGCAFLVINVSTFMNTEFENRFEDQLQVTVTLKEEGTDISMVKSGKIRLSFQIGKVEILDSPKNFEQGKAIVGKVKVTTFSGPIPNKTVYLSEGQDWSQKLLLNLTTDSDGLAIFSASVYPVEKYNSYKTTFFSTAEIDVQLLQPATPYSPVFSELKIESSDKPFKCDAEIPITISYYIIGETSEHFSIDLIYMVLSKGVIVHHGHETVEVEESTELRKGKISFKLSVVPELAPVVQVVAYSVLPSENILTTNKKFDVEKCFKNKVSLQFSPSKAVPGEKNMLEVSAHPESLCGLSVVDQSVFILESGNRLNIDKIFNLLPVTVVSDFPYSVEDEVECLHVRPQRDIRFDHVYETLKGVGLKMASNLAVRQPRCLVYKGFQYHRDHLVVGFRANSFGIPMALADFHESFAPIKTVRKFFPETWIWQLLEVGGSGSVQLPVTVPDTITTWETEAFCVSSKGLGVAPPVHLTVFQPFFLELSLPYSIIRGEVFELKATVFNYLSKCIMVKVTPAPSSDYTLEPSSSDGEYSSCLCANGRKTFRWTLIPNVLGVLNVTVSAEAEQSQTVCDNEIVSVPDRGRIDTVTRSLIVQAEGTEKTKSQSWLLCPQGNSVSEEFELTLPEDVIEGSARASLSVLGDILGRALKNLDGLLRMPYGCGEQNIALLAPNIHILQYLENTEQLTSEIRDKATGFLKSGYQRQLNYKHISGGYSTFGSGDENTWLTAFVLRTFGKAQRYIFIDPEVINSAKQWLIRSQGQDGCFIQQGSLFNKRMKGGVNDDVTITAYITASFLELGITVQDPVLSTGLECLKSSLGNLTTTYTTALLAYTFSLAGESEIREQLLKKLDKMVVFTGLSQRQMIPGSLSVEISSYVLLAVLTSGQLTAADLGYANRIVSWLVKQQNPYGGFSSTQDTVVALQALALYATKVFTSDGSSTVTVTSADGHSLNFDVNQNNKLLYQEKSLQDVPGKYSIDVKGSTCVSVQTALFYNVPTPAEISTLSITAKTEGNCTKSFGQTLAIDFSVIYNGELNSTNMIIVDIKILSGFTADPGELQNQVMVERVDSKDDHVIMYIKELQRNLPFKYHLHIKQALPIKNLKPALIKVYDYYQTNDQSETEYTTPCVYFMVTFPAVIESDSDAKFCVSLLKPNETLQMKIYLIHNGQIRTLLHKKVGKEFHSCSHFKAPQVVGNFEVQKIKVKVRGLILQLSHELNAEAPLGYYELAADTGSRLIKKTFTVEKYVLPKFEVTVQLPKEHSVGEEELKLEVCGKYIYGQPVPGRVVVEVCREVESSYIKNACLSEAKKLDQTGCAILIVNVSSLLDTKFKDDLDATVILTEEETDIAVVKHGTVGITLNIGNVEILDLPRTFENGKVIEGKVVSKGVIVNYGHEKVKVEKSADPRKGNVKIKLAVVPELAPVMQVVVYSVLPSDNVIAARRNFGVEKCFKNKVSLQFSHSKAVPGEINTLTVSALPGSLCGLTAVDQSVFILEPNKRLNINEIFGLLPMTVVFDYPYIVEDNMECLHVRPKRAVWVDDVYQTLKEVGLKMATNLYYRQPHCLVYKGIQYNWHPIGGSDYYVSLILPEDTPEMENDIPALQIRKLFLETWIWQLIEVGDSGSVQLPVTVPDTITTWETEAFCVSSKGLGVAPPVQLTVFQPFFLELSLPYSIIRGEVFELKATVFNYLSKCIMIKVTPAPSSDYTLEPSSDSEYSSCLCANERKTFKWTLIPIVLGVLNVTVSAEAEQSQTVCDNEIVSVPEKGRIDTVTRSLIVQILSKHTFTTGNGVSEELELILPEDVIEGSARASVSVLGDILGRALKNLDTLLMMPIGSGEQNIALLASNIYIFQYLKNTDQLTPKIHNKATWYLKQGYQKQLKFKHFNGAFSAFGSEEENTWLTAFVLKTFGKAQDYIFIDPQSINKATQWLINMQRTDGCFTQQGLLFDNRMKDPVVNKGIICLKSSIGNLRDTYTTALLAYTFSLAGEKELRGQLLKELDGVAISVDGCLHWSQKASEDSGSLSGSLSVEISSYVLLAVLTSSQLSAADLGYANRIVSWLVKQQNAYGGTTQDTVVALQALALYFTKVLSSDGSSTVTVKSADGHSHNFDVNQNNKLLYQEKALQDVPGKYSIDVKGATCVSVQAALVYNVPTQTETSKLSITATTAADCKVSFRETVSLQLTIIYNGKLKRENYPTKAIVDIKLLSGFKKESGELHQNIPVSFQLRIKQEHLIKNLKPALIKVYDVYQTTSSIQPQTSRPRTAGEFRSRSVILVEACRCALKQPKAICSKK